MPDAPSRVPGLPSLVLGLLYLVVPDTPLRVPGLPSPVPCRLTVHVVASRSLALDDYTGSTVSGASQGRGSPASCPIKGSALDHVHGRVLGCCMVVIAQWSERRQQRSEALDLIPSAWLYPCIFSFSCFYPDLPPLAYHHFLPPVVDNQ